jgi:hypothetical protein
VGTSPAKRFRTSVQRKLVHFGANAVSVKTSQKLTKAGQRKVSMRNLKLKLYPLMFAVIGAIAASGGYFRGR